MNLKELKNSDILVGMFLQNVTNEDMLHESLYSIAMQNEPVNLLVMHNGLSQEELDKFHAIAKNPTVKIKATKKENGEEEGPSTQSAGNALSYVIEQVDVKNFSDVFNHLFRSAVEHGYKIMSITEPEDVYSLQWFQMVLSWQEENKDMSMFLPLIKHMNFGVFQGFMNESCWAEGMAEEVGKYDNNLLLKFNFAAHPLGAAFIIENMTKESGAYESRDGALYPMKSSLKLFNYYEFFLRSAYNDNKMMNIPRIGYELRMTNLTSYNPLSSKIPNTLLTLPKDKGGVSPGEAQFWAKYATDAYFMEEDDASVEYDGDKAVA